MAVVAWARGLTTPNPGYCRATNETDRWQVGAWHGRKQAKAKTKVQTKMKTSVTRVVVATCLRGRQRLPVTPKAPPEQLESERATGGVGDGSAAMTGLVATGMASDAPAAVTMTGTRTKMERHRCCLRRRR